MRLVTLAGAGAWIFADLHLAALIPIVPLAAVLWWFLMVPAWTYLATPIYRVSGLFKYQSGFLRCTPGAEPNSVSLHLGTLYDLLWRVGPNRRRGERLAVAVRREIYQGLVRLCDRINSGEISPEASVTLCTYYVTPQQMAGLGFVLDTTSSEAQATQLLGCLSFTSAYLDLLLTRALILGRLRWFNPLRVAFYRSTASRLAENQGYFRRQAERG